MTELARRTCVRKERHAAVELPGLAATEVLAPSTPRRAQAAARLISCGNAQAVTGQSWRWCKAFALANNIPVRRVGRKSFIDAELLIAALLREAPGPAAENEPSNDNVDPAEKVRLALGKKRRLA